MTSRDEGRSRRSSPERHYRRDHHSPQNRSPRPRGRSPQERNRMMEERKRSPDQRRRSDDDRKYRSSMSASPPVNKRYRSGRRRKNSNDDYSDGGRRKRRKRSHRSPERRGDRSTSRRRGSPMPPPPHVRHRHYDDDPPCRRHRRRSTSLSSHDARAARRRGRRRYRGGRRGARRRSGDSISSNSARRPPQPVAADVAPRAGVVSEDDDHLGAHGALAVGGHTESRKPQSTTNTIRPAATKNNKRRSASSSRDDTVGLYKGREGSVIADRYRIIREVGVGTFGRVLECLDLKRSRSRRGRQEKTVAIKVVRNVKRYYESALIEADIVEDVNRRGGRGVTHCAVMFDAFTFANHYCMVFESLGPSLYDFLKRQKYQPFPLICVRDFAKQLLETLEFLHGFRLIHTDLKPENILLLNGREVSYKGYSIPECTRIKVIDFGGATYDNEKKSSVVNTRQYRAPEVILGVGWSMPSDLWSIGCILAELYQGELLFATHDNVEHLALIEQAIGPFPRRMLKKAKNAQLVTQAFDSMGAHRMALPPESLAYVKRIGPLEQLVFDDDTWFLRLLRRILVIDPEERATARECLRKF